VTHDRPRSAGPLPWDPLAAAAAGLAIDAATAEAVVALRDASLRSILLKGPSLDAMLYDAEEPRLYSDIDLLVPGGEMPRAGEVLRSIGYRERAGREPSRTLEHAKVWVRPSDRMYVDLHRTLGGIDRSDVDPWGVLATDTDSMFVGDAEVEILSEPGRALHVALHAAVSGASAEKPMIDLSRALERLSPETWKAAAALAERLGAQATFATGLRMQRAGALLCSELDLPTETNVETVMLADSAPYASWTVNKLMTTPGITARLRIVAPRLIPKPDFMRVWYPVARRGRAGLILAYVQRLAWLVKAAGPALSAWRRARSEARRAD
jgi:hypothetical protein